MQTLDRERRALEFALLDREVAANRKKLAEVSHSSAWRAVQTHQNEKRWDVSGKRAMALGAQDSSQPHTCLAISNPQS
jgi:hypothetical protein